MSRQYNPALTTYKRMDLSDFENLENVKELEKSNSGGLLSRSSMSMSTSEDDKKLNYTNPLVRIAKQMQIIRSYRNDINGNK